MTYRNTRKMTAHGQGRRKEEGRVHASEREPLNKTHLTSAPDTATTQEQQKNVGARPCSLENQQLSCQATEPKVPEGLGPPTANAQQHLDLQGE